MLLKPNPNSQKIEALVASNRIEEEYAQLVSLLRDSAGHYSLFPIRSDYDIDLRDALLARLTDDIIPLNLKLVRATEAGEDLVRAILRAACDKNCVVALIDLELLPDSLLPSRPGSERMARIASLNHGREALRRAGVPVLIWCNGASYQALRQDARDFFDHFTALFEFSDRKSVV